MLTKSKKLVKKKKKVSNVVVTNNDLVGYSLEDMLTTTYGAKGSSARNSAEARIKAIAEKLALNNTLKEIRENRNKSQHDVAKFMSVDDSVVSKLERNFEKAQIDTLIRYAKALKAKKVNIVFEFSNKEKEILNLHI